MSLQTASWLCVVVCNRLFFFSSSEVYCTDSQQIPPNKQHLSEAAPHMTFYSSQNTCDHHRAGQLFLLPLYFSLIEFGLLFLTCFHSVEMMGTQFSDIIVIALVLEGHSEVKVIIVDGDQRVGHVTFFYHTVQEVKSIWFLPLFQQTWCLVFTRCWTCC